MLLLTKLVDCIGPECARQLRQCMWEWRWFDCVQTYGCQALLQHHRTLTIAALRHAVLRPSPYLTTAMLMDWITDSSRTLTAGRLPAFRLTWQTTTLIGSRPLSGTRQSHSRMSTVYCRRLLQHRLSFLTLSALGRSSDCSNKYGACLPTVRDLIPLSELAHRSWHSPNFTAQKTKCCSRRLVLLPLVTQISPTVWLRVSWHQDAAQITIPRVVTVPTASVYHRCRNREQAASMLWYRTLLEHRV